MRRRDFLTTATATTCALANPFSNVFAQNADAVPPAPRPFFEPGEYSRIDATERTFHLCTSARMATAPNYEELFAVWRDAGVSDLWGIAWSVGEFSSSWAEMDAWLAATKRFGFRPRFVSIPFGHPALDASGGQPRWKPAERWDGSAPWGCSLHSPADVESVAALKTLYRRFGKFDYFLDDDFRFAASPNAVGGCVCSECRAGFLKAAGLDANRWNETLDDLRGNADTPLLRAWVDYFCDKLTAYFDAHRAAVPEVDLGIMVMYMGCERGGVRLDDYRDRGAYLRVGEGMFGDDWFDPPKCKTIELFSSLFHRRFCPPGRAFSETTVFPDGALTTENYASKLAVSTISDVRNTFYMCATGIPASEWPQIAARAAREKAFHSRLLGQKPFGPFKHFYGKAARYLGGENANSLFLALGVPFEVCEKIPADGWTFLSDADAAEIERGAANGGGSKLIARFASTSDRFSKVDENLESLFAFRRSILQRLQANEIPYVEEEKPVVLAWYPDAKLLYLWNLTQEKLTLHIRRGTKTTALELGPVDSALIEEAAFV